MREEKKYKGRATSGKLCLSVHPATFILVIRFWFVVIIYQVLRGRAGFSFYGPTRQHIGEITGGELERLEGRILSSGGRVKGKPVEPDQREAG